MLQYTVRKVSKPKQINVDNAVLVFLVIKGILKDKFPKSSVSPVKECSTPCSIRKRSNKNSKINGSIKDITNADNKHIKMLTNRRLPT